MGVAELRALVYAANQAAHGVSAVVTRPVPDNTPVTVEGCIWLEALDETNALGPDFRRREPRRALVLPRATLSTLPRGSLILAAEPPSTTARLWRVEGFAEKSRADQWWALVVPA